MYALLDNISLIRKKVDDTNIWKPEDIHVFFYLFMKRCETQFPDRVRLAIYRRHFSKKEGKKEGKKEDNSQEMYDQELIREKDNWCRIISSS